MERGNYNTMPPREVKYSTGSEISHQVLVYLA